MDMPTPEGSTPLSPRASTPQPRILACVLCQQRKVKCDRRSPCKNCVRAGAQCIAASTRQRRRRFPERELLERLRRYEELLRRNNIQFEPLHSSAATSTEVTRDEGVCHSERPSEGKPGAVHETKNFWHLMDKMVRPEIRRRSDSTSNAGALPDGEDSVHGGEEDRGNGSGSSPCEDEQGVTVMREAFDHEYGNSDHGFLFGARKNDVDLCALHPSQVHIFRLWQIYLDNVNPLLKVTHTPTLQSRIIDAAGNVANVNPTMTALMFAVYCVATASLTDEESQALFGSSRRDLLRGYQFGCQQALLSCGVMRSASRDSLTAFYLYLVSTRSCTDPRALCSTFGVVFRIAQRMGLHSESANARYSPLEGEMRRRLWWSLVMFDNRICELSDQRTSMLIPTWDCRMPLNVNDFDLQSEMKVAPSDHNNTPTEALFAVVRSELGNFVRHCDSHLDFTNPILKPLAEIWRKTQRLEDADLPIFETVLENKYLRYCNPENPLHFMTMWTTGGQLAKYRLMDHHLRYSSVVQTDSQRNAAISYALRMLECDTKLLASPLTKRYRWLLNFYFPLPAYLHIAQDLTKRPLTDNTKRSCWQAMSENYRARLWDPKQSNLFFDFFSRIILQAWEACRSRSGKGQSVEPPTIVADITHRLAERKSKEQPSDPEQRQGAASKPMEIDGLPMPMSMGIDGSMLLFGMDEQSLAGPGLGLGYSDMPGQSMMDLNLGLSSWNIADWHPMHFSG